MQCPQCQFECADEQDACPMCGVYFAKLQKQNPFVANTRYKPPPDLVNHPDQATWVCMGVGLGLAILAETLTLPRIALQGLMTLFHEFGHAVAGWIFGCPSIPAFDFRYGGGMTMIQDRETALLILAYLILAGGIVFFRKNPLTLSILGALLLFHAVASFGFSGRVYKGIIYAAGHGAEILFAVVFLYRAWANVSVAHEAERYACALVGWFFVIHDALFNWRLMASNLERQLYSTMKGGHWMDYDAIHRFHLPIGQSSIAGLFLLACLLAPMVAFLLYRYRVWMLEFLDLLLTPDPSAR